MKRWILVTSDKVNFESVGMTKIIWGIGLTCSVLFLNSLSATMLSFPGRCLATMLMLKWVTEKQMHLSKCIIIISVHDPLQQYWSANYGS